MTLKSKAGATVAVLVAAATLAPAAAFAVHENPAVADQYGSPTTATGPLAGASASISDNGDGVVGPGDTITISGDFELGKDTVSITLQDGDGTRGGFTRDINARIFLGSVIIEPTAAPVGVTGGNGTLNASGLTVFATAGISPAASGGGEGTTRSSAGGVLPRTGGEFAFLFAGLFALVGSGLALRRATRGKTS